MFAQIYIIFLRYQILSLNIFINYLCLTSVCIDVLHRIRLFHIKLHKKNILGKLAIGTTHLIFNLTNIIVTIPTTKYHFTVVLLLNSNQINNKIYVPIFTVYSWSILPIKRFCVTL